MWNEERVYFPLEITDYEAILENQRVQKIKFRKISTQYKDSLSFITQQILEQDGDSEVRKAIRLIEKGA